MRIACLLGRRSFASTSRDGRSIGRWRTLVFLARSGEDIIEETTEEEKISPTLMWFPQIAATLIDNMEGEEAEGERRGKKREDGKIAKSSPEKKK